MLGPIRQELLSGIKDKAQFELLREHLRAFPDLELDTDDYEAAASAFHRFYALFTLALSFARSVTPCWSTSSSLRVRIAAERSLFVGLVSGGSATAKIHAVAKHVGYSCEKQGRSIRSRSLDG
jgi:hypothetical protein